MKILNYETDFDIFELTCADKFEAETKKVIAKTDEYKAEISKKQKAGEAVSLSWVIGAQCDIVFSFFDSLLGDGTSKKIFGESTNLRTATKAYTKFNTDVLEAKNELLSSWGDGKN